VFEVSNSEQRGSRRYWKAASAESRTVRARVRVCVCRSIVDAVLSLVLLMLRVLFRRWCYCCWPLIQAWMDALEQSVLSIFSERFHRHVWMCGQIMEQVAGARSLAEYRGVLRGSFHEPLKVPFAWAMEHLAKRDALGFRTEFSQVMKVRAHVSL
jgi:hypothetical protein